MQQTPAGITPETSQPVSTLVKVTRNGDQFSCQYGTDAVESASLGCVFAGASSVAASHQETAKALYFIKGVLEAHADTGEPLDEAQARGVAALCGIMLDAMESVEREHYLGIDIVRNAALARPIKARRA